MDFNVLTTTLSHFIDIFSTGQRNIQNLQGGVLRALLIIEIALAACWIALDASSMSSIFKKLLTLGFWIFFAKEFGTLAHQFSDSLVKVGLSAGGTGGTVAVLLDPSSIAGNGLEITAPLVKLLDNIGITAFKDAFIFSLAYLVIMACYIVMALQVFLAVIEYYLVLTLACALIPFGMSQHTKFLAEKAIGAVVACSIKLMVLAFMLSVIEPTLGTIRFASEEIKLNELMSVILSSVALAFLVWTAPGLAAGLLAGSPTLSAAGITQNVAAAAAVATGAVTGALGSTRAAAGTLAGGGAGALRSAGSMIARGAGSSARAAAGASVFPAGRTSSSQSQSSGATATATPPSWATEARTSMPSRSDGGPPWKKL